MKNQKYVWNIVLVLAITVIALYFALKDNFNTIVHAILSMNILSLLVVLFWGALFTIVWGFVYVVLGRKYIPKYSDSISFPFLMRTKCYLCGQEKYKDTTSVPCQPLRFTI